MAKREGADQIGGVPIGTIGERGIVLKSAGQFATVLQNQYATANVSSTPYAVGADAELYVDASSSSITIDLPEASTADGKIYYIVKVDSTANSVVIDPYGAELINGQASFALTDQYAGVQIGCNGVAWFILNSTSSGPTTDRGLNQYYETFMLVSPGSVLLPAEVVGITRTSSNAQTLVVALNKVLTAGSLTVRLRSGVPGDPYSTTVRHSVTMTSASGYVVEDATGTGLIADNDIIELEAEASSLDWEDSGTVPLQICVQVFLGLQSVVSTVANQRYLTFDLTTSGSYVVPTVTIGLTRDACSSQTLVVALSKAISSGSLVTRLKSGPPGDPFSSITRHSITMTGSSGYVVEATGAGAISDNDFIELEVEAVSLNWTDYPTPLQVGVQVFLGV